jgi:cbb3-type cytochrome oxidase subunit 3
LYFGGHFRTLFEDARNLSAFRSLASLPIAPDNTQTTGDSGYLTPYTIPAQVSQYGALTIQAEPSSSDANHNNANLILCTGSDTWFARDASVASVDILANTFLSVSGVRIANGRIDNRATTQFTLTTLPDNTVRTLRYGDGSTCNPHCELSTESDVWAQDFVFDDGLLNISGLRIVLEGWSGDGAAIDYIELLSDGAYASFVGSSNTGLCGSSNTSVNAVGDWQSTTATSSLPGTQIAYMQAEVPVNNVQSTMITLYPYVGSSGYYDVYLVIPGCANIGDCASRTTVDTSFFPQQGSSPWTDTLDERVQADTNVLIYSGLVDATSGDFTPTLTVALPASPAPVDSDAYIIVAGGVQMVLTGLSNTTSPSASSSSISPSRTSSVSSASATPTSTNTRSAFGVFEWARAGKTEVNAASATLPNTTETLLTQLGFSLDAAKNASSGDFFVASVAELNNTLFVSGSFELANSYANVVAVDNSGATALANRGLNGAVNASVTVGNKLFFGGEFTGTAQGNVGLQHLAQYSPSNKSWSAVDGGVDGPVSYLQSSSDGLVVVGDFTNVIFANGSTVATGGYAVYNTTTSQWAPSGVVYGTSSAASPNGTLIAGRFLGASQNSVAGVASLVNKNGVANIQPLPNVAFSPKGSSTAATRRSFTFLNHLRRALHLRADAIPVPDLPTEAPATVTGAYWTNSSASSSPAITILGGNFTSGDFAGVAFQSSSGLTGPSPAVSGVVRALAVLDDTLFVGGSSLTVPGVGKGLLSYDLKSGSWENAVQLTGSDVTVNALRVHDKSIVVGGSFASVNEGAYSCAAVCFWDTEAQRWDQPGRDATITSGHVASLDFGDSLHGTLVVGGSFVLGGKATYAAQFSFANNTWNTLGSLPGPVLSIAVNDKNLSSIFATGVDAETSEPYLQQWNGVAWVDQSGSGLADGTVIQQLAFVPLRQNHEHSANGVIERNRMLLANGDITLPSGKVSAALYDGSTWYPYLVGSTSQGTLGSISSLFWSDQNFSFSAVKYLARGLVVLVAMAIATGLILLLILLILLGAYCLRRHERKQQPVEAYDEKDTQSEHSSTHRLIHDSVQTALERSLMRPQPAHLAGDVAAAGVGASAGLAAGAALNRRSSESHLDDDDQFDDSDESGRESVMRYDFFGPELQPGELPMRAGQRVIVLDDEQSDEWWYCRDPDTGREGVVPATYLL